MTNKLKDKIILPAWELINNDSKIKKYYTFPGILSIIFLTALLVYQFIYTYVKIIGEEAMVLEKILHFLESDYGFEAIVGGVIFLIIYFLFIPVFEGGLLKYIDLKNKGTELSSGEAFGQGLYNFFPIFEYNNLFSEFKILSIINFYLFTIRFVGVEYIGSINYAFIIIMILGLVLNILFAYSKYAIIVNKKGVFESIGESSKITLLNLKITVKLYFLMLFLNFRVIINFIIFLFFPIIIVVAIGLITTKFLMLIAVTILSIMFIIVILALGYLTAVLEVFTAAVWYYAYIEGKKMLED